jgi:phosphohistidine phosphatase
MNLFILRHASAGVIRVNPLLDAKRPLDKDGKQHCLVLAHTLNAMKIQFDLIVSSPLKRSLQTASLVGTETGYENRILLSNALAPDATFSDFQRLLSECKLQDNLLVVGHNPNISQFVAALLVPSSATTIPVIRMRKGSLARLSVNRSPAMLQWLLDPRMVRGLYTTSTKSSRRKISRK